MDFIVILAACTSTSSVPSPLLYVEIDRASRVFTAVIFAHSGCIVMLSSTWCFCKVILTHDVTCTLAVPLLCIHSTGKRYVVALAYFL